MANEFFEAYECKTCNLIHKKGTICSTFVNQQKGLTQKSHNEENIKLFKLLLARSGDEPYKCFQCKSGFALKEQLNKHLSIQSKGIFKNYVYEVLAL